MHIYWRKTVTVTLISTIITKHNYTLLIKVIQQLVEYKLIYMLFSSEVCRFFFFFLFIFFFFCTGKKSKMSNGDPVEVFSDEESVSACVPNIWMICKCMDSITDILLVMWFSFILTAWKFSIMLTILLLSTRLTIVIVEWGK